jgi:hypothetical protein
VHNYNVNTGQNAKRHILHYTSVSVSAFRYFFSLLNVFYYLKVLVTKIYSTYSNSSSHHNDLLIKNITLKSMTSNNKGFYVWGYPLVVMNVMCACTYFVYHEIVK